jgi:lysophospholipid acyltransferase (LPLAT)-like uncharacterized protein
VAILHRASLLHFLTPCKSPITVLIGDRQPNLYTRLARVFGYQVLSAAPWSALRRCLGVLARSGALLVVAVDGPAGPPGAVAPGLAKLGRLSGAPLLVPLRCSMARTLQLADTWDT